MRVYKKNNFKITSEDLDKDTNEREYILIWNKKVRDWRIKMLIREYQSSDCDKLAKLFYNTVHIVNAKDYSSEKLNVWATGQIDLKKWNQSFLEHHCLVAIDDGMIVGFGDIDCTGYLDRLFVHSHYQRRGIATALCNQLEQLVNVNTITTHASITAKPFFETRGYQVIKEQQVERQGIKLINFVMVKER